MSDKALKSEQVMTRMKPETVEALKAIAAEMDRSVSWLLNDLATKFIASREPVRNKAATKPATN